MGEWRDVCKSLMGKPEGKRQLGRPRRRLEDNIKMYLQEVGFGGMGYIELDQVGQMADNCECGYELSISVKCWEFLD